MTYYRILQYLKKNGLDDGKAHYVRNMIRKLVEEAVWEDREHYPSIDWLEESNMQGEGVEVYSDVKGIY